MKNKLQPTRTSFSRNFQCKKAPRWLSKFFHFGTENRADQLKKPPCIYVYVYPIVGYGDIWSILTLILEIAWQNWQFKIGLSLLDFKQLLVDSGTIVQWVNLSVFSWTDESVLPPQCFWHGTEDKVAEHITKLYFSGTWFGNFTTNSQWSVQNSSAIKY